MSMKKILILGLGAALLATPLAATRILAASTNISPPAMKSVAQPAVDTIDVQPHRALYQVTLSSVNSGGQLVDISGKMYFEWKKSCDSWTTDHRSSLVYEYSDGTTSRINSDFASYETLDGKTLSFSSKRDNNGVPFEEFRGHANLASDDSGDAQYTIPGNLNFKLPKNTFFPMAHTHEILEAAKKGQKFFNASLFDGSDDQGPQQVNVFIGDKIDPLTTVNMTKSIDKTLLNSPAHRMRLAFFPSEDNDGNADYEMDLVALDNGVVSDIKIIYDTFTITQKLVALEKIDAPACTENSAYAPATDKH